MDISADLHTHSNASDGDLSPLELVTLAASRDLSTLALTDHDTLSGIQEAVRASTSHSLAIIPGIEISAEYGQGMLHILGYFSRYPQGLEESLQRVQEARRERIPKIIARLNASGIPLGEADVWKQARGAQVGRPHIAKALLQKGYVRTFDEAFEELLGRGKKAYVPKEKMSWQKAVDLVRIHGGLPVLAHPSTLGLDGHALATFLHEMATSGLAGIEAYYPEHSPDQVSLYLSLASDLDLVITGGTDFHGTARNHLFPGDHGLDDTLLEKFLRRLQTDEA